MNNDINIPNAIAKSFTGSLDQAWAKRFDSRATIDPQIEHGGPGQEHRDGAFVWTKINEM